MSKGRMQLKEQGMHCASIMHRPLRNSRGHGQHFPAPPMAFVGDVALTHLERFPMQQEHTGPCLLCLASAAGTLCVCVWHSPASPMDPLHNQLRRVQGLGQVYDLGLSRGRVLLSLQVTLCLVLPPTRHTVQQVTG